LLAQLGEGDGSAAAERIAAADRENQRLGGDHTRTDLRRHRLSAAPDDRGVDVAVGNSLEERLVVLLGDRDLDRGMARWKSPSVSAKRWSTGPATPTLSRPWSVPRREAIVSRPRPAAASAARA
jgi:hypothetical protein